MSVDGLGSLLDSAVKTAVYRLANSDIKRQGEPPADVPTSLGQAAIDRARSAPPVDRSRVDFLYYEGSPPYYDYYYDNDYNDVKVSDEQALPPPWLNALSKSGHRWRNQHHQTHSKWRPPLSDGFDRRVDRMDLSTSSVGSGPLSRVSDALTAASTYFPLLVVLPLVAAASYYLLVVNAPTPVVKERMVATADQLAALLVRVIHPEGSGGDADGGGAHHIIQ